MSNCFNQNCGNCLASLDGNIEFVTDNGSKIRDVVNYFKFINHTRETINEKLEILSVRNNNEKKRKRGIADGLGSILKLFTGNLDAYDGQKYDKLIENIKNDQFNIKNQIASQYSVSTDIIVEFNKTVNIIEENFSELRNKMLFINKKLDDFVELEKFRDVLNQLNILCNMLLSLVQDIENSLTFCKLGTLHPSIISTKELFYEIEKIHKYYNNKLPLEPKIENMWEFENLLEVSCKIGKNEIIYSLDLPIVDETDFNTYKLYSVPTKYESGYVTIIPTVKYLLVSKSKLSEFRILGLDNKCNDKIQSKFLCSLEQISHNELNCETSIIQHGTTDNCKYTALEIMDNLIKWIPEMNQYLAIFPQKETFKITNQKETLTKTIQGIYLINPNSDTIFYQDKQLYHSSKTEGGHPKLLDASELRLSVNQQPEFSLNLKNIEFDKINLDTISSIPQKTIIVTEISVWTIIIYVMLLVGILYLTYRIFFKKPQPGPNSQQPLEVLFRDGGVI